MDDSRDAPEDFQSLLSTVVEASENPARSRPEHLKNIRPDAEKLTSLAYEHGILPEPLEELVDLLTVRNHLDQATLGNLTRNLYPASKIASGVIVKVVGALGHGQLKPSLAIQALLLKWIVMVYHVIDQPGVLSQCYPVLFNLLDTAGIRPQLCHVLALITRRKHVKVWRIQALLELCQHSAGDVVLYGLLRVYKEYYPEIIARLDGKPSVFKHPNLEWRTHLDHLQAAHLRKLDEISSGSQSGFRVFRSLRQKHVLPHAVTPRAGEDAVTLEEVSSAWDLVKNLEKIPLPSQLIAIMSDPLLQKLSLLRPDANVEVQHRASRWVEAFQEDVALGEVNESELTGVLSVMKDYVVSMKHAPPAFLNFIETLFRTWDGQTGKDDILQILGYCPIIPFEDLNTHLFTPLLTHLTSTTTPASAHHSLLTLHTTLLHHWLTLLRGLDQSHFPSPTHTTWSTIKSLTTNATHLSLTLLLLTTTTATTLSSPSPGSASPSETDAHLTILSFLTVFSAAITDPKLQHYISIVIPSEPLIYRLFFSSSLAVVSRTCAVLAAYKCAFEKVMARLAQLQSPTGGAMGSRPGSQGSIVSISQMLGSSQLQASQSQGAGASGGQSQQLSQPGAGAGASGPGSGGSQQPQTRQSSLAPLASPSTPSSSQPKKYQAAYVNQFNSYLMDTCNCLWRGRAFNVSDINARGCFVTPVYVDALSVYVASLTPVFSSVNGGEIGKDLVLGHLFSLSYNPVTAMEAIAVVREKEDEVEGGKRHPARPVTQASLTKMGKEGWGVEMGWGWYRLAVLRRLREKGCDGVEVMMFNTMKNLMHKK